MYIYCIKTFVAVPFWNCSDNNFLWFEVYITLHQACKSMLVMDLDTFFMSFCDMSNTYMGPKLGHYCVCRCPKGAGSSPGTVASTKLHMSYFQFLWLSSFKQPFSDIIPNGRRDFQKYCGISAFINSLWPSDTMWWHRSGTTLAQVMACCLMAPSRYLNQSWLEIICIYPSAISHKMEKICWENLKFNF